MNLLVTVHFSQMAKQNRHAPPRKVGVDPVQILCRQGWSLVRPSSIAP
jgi:hypothetical protein